MAVLRLLIVLTALHGAPAVAGPEFSPSSVEKGVFLVASPSLNDPNFRETVVLVLEHGPQGTLGLILNRATDMLLSEALPDVSVLKGTTHRLFAGGPVQPNVLLLLSRLKNPQPGMRSVFGNVYVGGAPDALERIITQAGSAASFRAFAGYAGWAPGQLGFEMIQGSWAVLSAESDLFDRDPAALWPDSLARLQAPRVISR
jgi:putative transcriptional regulator